MKKTLLLLTLVLAASSFGWAGACTSGALDTYLASGFSCTEGGLTFSDFTYLKDTTSPPSSSVTVTALGNGLGFGPFSVSPGELLNFSVVYTVTGDLDTVKLSVDSPSITNLGTIVAFENIFANGQFFSTNLQNGLSSILALPELSGPFRIEKDLILSARAGVGSMASVQEVVNQSNVPEPGSLLLFGSGLLGLGGYIRRRQRK